MKNGCCFKCEREENSRKKVTEDFNCHDDAEYCPNYAAKVSETKRVTEIKQDEYNSWFKNKEYFNKIGRR